MKDIPVIGEVLSGYSLFVYLSWVFVIMVWIFLYRTPYGFWIRASGEHPSALETAGIDPVKTSEINKHLKDNYARIEYIEISLEQERMHFYNCPF